MFERKTSIAWQMFELALGGFSKMCSIESCESFQTLLEHSIEHIFAEATKLSGLFVKIKTLSFKNILFSNFNYSFFKKRSHSFLSKSRKKVIFLLAWKDLKFVCTIQWHRHLKTTIFLKQISDNSATIEDWKVVTYAKSCKIKCAKSARKKILGQIILCENYR